MARKPTQQELSDLVHREVVYCVSSLIDTLAKGYGSDTATGELREVSEEAFELCNAVESYEDAAFEEGIEVRETDDGEWQYSTKGDRDEAAAWEPNDREDYCPAFRNVGADNCPLSREACEADHIHHDIEEDRPNPWQNLDDADDEESAYREACEAESVDPHQWEVYEHWIVSDWLARKLRAQGERVGECGGLTIWGRTTTGQAIAMDSVIEDIWLALHANDAEATS